MHPLACRLLRLDRRDKQPPMAWLNPGETPELARVRWCSEHPDEDPATTDLPNGFGESEPVTGCRAWTRL
jgi:hypothetical protein